MARKKRKKKKEQDDWEYVEVKSGEAQLTKAQEKFEKEIIKNGGTYNVERVDNLW